MMPNTTLRLRLLATAAASLALATSLGCASASADTPPNNRASAADVIPGVEVLLSDSLHLLRGKRVG
jgi:hypothetical protein